MTTTVASIVGAYHPLGGRMVRPMFPDRRAIRAITDSRTRDSLARSGPVTAPRWEAGAGTHWERGVVMKVLVTAATKYGSTGEIARAIGDVLAEGGSEIDVIPPEGVRSIEGYDAVVIGSGVYAGHWLEPATQLVDGFGDALAARPVWLFSSGPVGDPSRKLVQKMGEDSVDVTEMLAITKARDHRVFAGKIDRKNLSFPERAMLVAFRGLEGDFRDWDEIRLWASEIADTLESGP